MTFEQMGGSKVDQGTDTRPDTIPPVSGRPTRRSPDVVYVGDVLLNVFPVPVRVVSVYPHYFRTVFA